MNSVAASFCADVNHGIADAFGFGQKDFFFFRDSEREGIDERILRITLLEAYFTADRGNAEAVPVASYAADYAIEDTAVLHGLFFCRVFIRRGFPPAPISW